MIRVPEKFSEETKRLFSNSSFLALIQIANYAFPLLTFPYLFRVLGVEIFGVLAIATALMQYVNIIIDYGFNLIGPREVSKKRSCQQEISYIYSGIQIIKVSISLVFLSIIVSVSCLTDFMRGYVALYWIVFLGCVFNSLLPVWLFQGLEQMKVVSIVNLVARLIYTISVFLIVKEKSDYLLAPLVSSILSFFSLVLITMWISKKISIRFFIPKKDDIFLLIKSSWFVFLSQIKISLFSNTNVLILGGVSGPIAVGYYSSAEKIMRALAMIQTPITQAIYPQISLAMQAERLRALVRLRKVSLYGGVFYIVILLFVYFSSELICSFLFGSSGKEVMPILQVMLPIPCFIFLNNIFGTQILLNVGREKEFFFIILIVSLCSLVLCSFLSVFFQAYGAAIALLLSEGLLLFLFACFVRNEFLRKG